MIDMCRSLLQNMNIVYIVSCANAYLAIMSCTPLKKTIRINHLLLSNIVHDYFTNHIVM